MQRSNVYPAGVNLLALTYHMYYIYCKSMVLKS